MGNVEKRHKRIHSVCVVLEELVENHKKEGKNGHATGTQQGSCDIQAEKGMSICKNNNTKT
eukprot:7574292-Ditylum_brightwellii.AAC.1